MFVLQAALVEMNDSALTIDQLDALSRAVPDDTERKDIRLYLQVTCSHCNTQIVSGLLQQSQILASLRQGRVGQHPTVPTLSIRERVYCLVVSGSLCRAYPHGRRHKITFLVRPRV